MLNNQLKLLNKIMLKTCKETNHKLTYQIITSSLASKYPYKFSLQKQMSQLKKPIQSFNDRFSQINQSNQKQNKFAKNNSQEVIKTLSSSYSMIDEQIQTKKLYIEVLLRSSERNLYKIVEECIVCLQILQKCTNQYLQQHLITVIKGFNNKLVSAYLWNLQEPQDDLATNNSKENFNHVQINKQNDENIDGQYQITKNNFLNIKDQIVNFQDQSFTVGNHIIDDHFIFYYIQTIKNWALKQVENEAFIKQVENQILQFLTVREVSDIQQTLRSSIKNIVKNYIEQPDFIKRDNFSFDKKIRSLCLLPYLSKKEIELYLNRLTQQNLIPYLKQSQILCLVYNISQLHPNLSSVKSSSLIHQIQSSKSYQNLIQLNLAYIKSRFITYVRNFMVCYQQIQFYDTFRELENRYRVSSVNSLLKLAEVLRVQSADLHSDYNKMMNKNTYNSFLTIVMLQNYNVQNIKLDQLLRLFHLINSIQKSGEVLYEEINKYLTYMVTSAIQFNPNQYQSLLKLFKIVIQQSKVIYKYQQKQGLNKQFGKKTINLVSTLFNILLPLYPQVLIIGYKFIYSYIHPDELIIYSPVENKQVKTPNDQVINKVNVALNNILQNRQQYLAKKQDNLNITNIGIIETIIYCLNLDTEQQIDIDKISNQNRNATPLLNRILKKQNPYQYLIDTLIIPLITKLQVSAINPLIQCLKLIQTINLLKKFPFNKINQPIIKFVNKLESQIIQFMGKKLQQKRQRQQTQIKDNILFIKISTKNNHKQIMLCLGQVIKFYSKLTKEIIMEDFFNHQNFNIVKSNLKLIFDFINNIGISAIKSCQQSDILNFFSLITNIQLIKNKTHPTQLLQFKIQIYQLMYSTLSVFVIHVADKGKNYIKQPSNKEIKHFYDIIKKFVDKKEIFKCLKSKKKIIMPQIILTFLIKKRYIEFNQKHLKKSDSAQLVLSFLQIFEFQQNLTQSFKKIVSQIQFFASDLEQYQNNMLQNFSQINFYICQYLEDNKINLTSPKKLEKLTQQQLRNEFKQEKIYEMIVRNTKFQLPFQMPQPQSNDPNIKLVYIIQKIYQKLQRKTKYFMPISKRKAKQLFAHRSEQVIQKQILQPQGQSRPLIQVLQQLSLNQTISSGESTQLVNEIKYIKDNNLVSYVYQEHYKLGQNKLPHYFKTQTWKSIHNLFKDAEIQALEIDQKIDQNIYKLVLLALLGYVQKVKIVMKQFHPHNYIAYCTKQLDLQLFMHGCVAKVNSKNKPTQNVIFVCAQQHNYKLLYICTHILRKSGQNAYILNEKVTQVDYKLFLQKQFAQKYQQQISIANLGQKQTLQVSIQK